MDDLLQSQIRESCKLALPNGLQELMADLSREVLRAQPNNIYQFIADYLSALLVARENLSVAARVCDNVCNARCWPELEDELRIIDLSEEDIKKTLEVVREFFENGNVKEGNLLLRLLKKTEIEEDQLSSVLTAVRGAFLAHKLNTDLPHYSSSSMDSDLDETARAAKHTLNLYMQTLEPGEDHSRAAEKIQAAYRAHQVRHRMRDHELDALANTSKEDNAEKSIRFKRQMQELFPDGAEAVHRCARKASSMSLAGSFITLPPFTPYSNTYSDILEPEDVLESEAERASIDYIGTNPDRTVQKTKETFKYGERKKSISFHESHEILYTSWDEETSETEEGVNKFHENETNKRGIDKGAIIDVETKNYSDRIQYEDMSNIKIGEEINKEMLNSETIAEEADIHEEMTNCDASDQERDIEEELPNDEENGEGIGLIENVMNTLNHDEFTNDDCENDFMLDNKVGDDDESDGENSGSPDLYSNKDFNCESSSSSSSSKETDGD